MSDEGAMKRLRGVTLRQSTYKLVLAAMDKADIPYDTLTSFIDNAVEIYARTLLSTNDEPGENDA